MRRGAPYPAYSLSVSTLKNKDQDNDDWYEINMSKNNPMAPMFQRGNPILAAPVANLHRRSGVSCILILWSVGAINKLTMLFILLLKETKQFNLRLTGCRTGDRAIVSGNHGIIPQGQV